MVKTGNESQLKDYMSSRVRIAMAVCCAEVLFRQFLKHDCQSGLGEDSRNFSTFAQDPSVWPWFAVKFNKILGALAVNVGTGSTDGGLSSIALQFVLCTMVTGVTFTLS